MSICRIWSFTAVPPIYERLSGGLPAFIADYNQRFSVAPQTSQNAHRKLLHDSAALNLILSLHTPRKLSRNLTCRYRSREYQIQGQGHGYRLRGSTVTACMCQWTLAPHVTRRPQRVNATRLPPESAQREDNGAGAGFKPARARIAPWGPQRLLGCRERAYRFSNCPAFSPRIFAFWLSVMSVLFSMPETVCGYSESKCG